MSREYKLTTLSCFVGIFVQAIIATITAILFIPLMDLYGFSYIHLGILVAVNFSAQVASDLIFSGLIDRIGFKRLVLPADICSFFGLILFALAPYLFDNVFTGIVISTIIFSASSGLLEVLLSPIVNAIPNEHKGPAMSLMHSFYAWGQVATIVVTTLFIFLFGGQKWQIIVLVWSIIPLINFFMFLRAPFPDVVPEDHRLKMSDLMLKPFFMLALFAIFFGAATEIIMNEWASVFMEKGLGLSKVTGDLIGVGGFAVMMGLGRVLYGRYGAKMNINNILIFGSLISVGCYIVAGVSPVNGFNIAACALCGLVSSLLWPGTLVISAEKYPLAGAWMFAILAASGDIGAAVGPWLTGLAVENFADTAFVGSLSKMLHITVEQAAIRTGVLMGVVFPVLAFICHILLKRKGRSLS
ncbi:MAG: MFS transporter [Mahellales bacterium]|jgi:MFS family permease